jgi:hypothetical protein
VSREWLAGRIVTLLKHYFEADEDPAVIREMARDWIEVLGELPEAAIAEACRTYLCDEPRKRPTPGAIRGLALKVAVRDARIARPALPPPPEPERVPATPEARARILAEFGLTERHLTAISNGRRMPRPGTMNHDEPEPIRPTVEEIAARPYTDAERARMAHLRGSRVEPGDLSA